MSIFSKVSFRKPKRTVHNLSYSTKFSMPFGRLVPIMCEKVVPGDKSWHSHEYFLRMAPFVNQVFQGFQVRTEYFFVPTRLLWKNFEMWLSKGMSGDSSYVHPYLGYKSVLQSFVNENKDNVNTIFDYLNLPTLNLINGEFDIDPTSISDDLKIDALPFYAIAKIFLDYYADENLDYAPLIEAMESTGVVNGPSFNINLFATDGTNNLNLRRLYARLQGVGGVSGSFLDTFLPLKRSWPKDYFTSALPFAQRGPVVQIPMNGQGDVVVTAGSMSTRYENVSLTTNQTGTDVDVTLYAGGGIDQSGNVSAENSTNDSTNQKLKFRAVNINGTATITDLRTAIAIQNFLEKRARGGTRAKEQIFSSFGVKTRDYRLDRSELLQATTNYVNIGEVYTATANEAETDIAGMAVSTGKAANTSKTFKHYFEEHGYLIGFMSVFPTASYYQGIPRQFMELDQFDYYWPEFQHIGEQDVSSRELYLDGTPQVFGYQPRYSQYKTRTNQIHSEFRTNLRFMTAAREFLSNPTLSNNFVQINPELENLYKVFRTVTPLDNSNPVYIDLYHHHKMLRPMSYFGTPRFL